MGNSLSRTSYLEGLRQLLNARGLEGYKSYPLLKILRIVISIIGWVFIVLGALGTLASLGSAFIGFREIWNAPTQELPSLFLRTFLSGFGLFIPAVVTTILGIGYVGAGELIKLLMDLQSNADRQSILLTMLYYQSTQKAKDNEPQKPSS